MNCFLSDAYERMQPSPDGPALYDTLEWFFRNDPWVTKAVEDARSRKVVVDASDVDVVVKAFSGFPAVRWPQRGIANGEHRSLPSHWRVAAAIHQLSKTDPKKARILAYQNYASVIDSTFPSERFFANHLIHVLDQIKN